MENLTETQINAVMDEVIMLANGIKEHAKSWTMGTLEDIQAHLNHFMKQKAEQTAEKPTPCPENKDHLCGLCDTACLYRLHW